MISDLVFYTGIALLLTHEMDAIYRHEWRMFPLICRLSDDVGYHVFVVAHIPLFVLLFWLMHHPSGTVLYWFHVCMDGFFIVHLGLHLLLKSHDQNEFSSVLSKFIIFATALAGATHLILIMT